VSSQATAVSQPRAARAERAPVTSIQGDVYRLLGVVDDVTSLSPAADMRESRCGRPCSVVPPAQLLRLEQQRLRLLSVRPGCSRARGTAGSRTRRAAVAGLGGLVLVLAPGFSAALLIGIVTAAL
jgi:hypothetical protein